MKRLLLSLCLVGAVFLAIPANLLQTAKVLPHPAEQRVEARAVSARFPVLQCWSPWLRTPNSGFERVAVQITGDDTGGHAVD